MKQSNDPLESRAGLVTVFHIGGCVFLNCTGFIKIDHSRDDSYVWRGARTLMKAVVFSITLTTQSLS